MAGLMWVMAILCSLTLFSASADIELSEAELATIAQRIWLNEGAGKEANLTVWNRGEDFPSFGIGHFIWYPRGVSGRFSESFPEMRDFVSRTHPAPEWLAQLEDAPWSSREQFYAEIKQARLQSMRQWLSVTKPQQAQFIVQRMQAALPKLLAEARQPALRRHIEQQFYAVSQASNGWYALIDYVNFKGEGINPKERYQGQGWGLFQVLQTMSPGASDVMAEFVWAADTVLTRRVDNAPRDERRWLPGWRKRLQTYVNR